MREPSSEPMSDDVRPAAASEVVELAIEALAPGGDGVGRLGARAVFVPATLPGERVRASIPAARPGAGPLQAELVEVLSPSPSRRPVVGCPHFGECGGCQWLHASPALQLRAKEEAFRQALGEVLDGVEVAAIDGDGPELGYRARTTLHVARGALGFSQRASHEVVAVRRCLLLDERLNGVLDRLQGLLGAPDEGGALRLPRGCTDVALACDDERVSAAFFLDRLTCEGEGRIDRLVRHAGIKGAVAVFPERGLKTFGKPMLSRPAPCSTRGARLFGRADLFAQAHAAANARLVAQALQQMGDVDGALELFGGSGNFTLALAERARGVVSIELCASALELARQSARAAGLTNVRFIGGDAIASARQLIHSGERFDALLLDPPRAGAPGIADLARTSGVRRVVYVSCNPVTLCRDARALIAAGFRPTFARPLDLFPQTVHVEAVITFERAS